jgi:hypothetical protein
MFKYDNGKIHNLILYIIDIVSVTISYILATLFWLGVVKHSVYMARERVVNEIGLVFFSFLIVIFLFNMNKDFFKRSRLEELLYVMKINIIFLAFASFIMFIGGSKSMVSRGAYVFAVLFNIIFMFGFHLLFKGYLKNVYAKKKKNTQMFIITTEDRAEKTVKRLLENPDWINRIHAVAIIDAEAIGTEICGVKVVADAYTMLEYVRKEAIEKYGLSLSEIGTLKRGEDVQRGDVVIPHSEAAYIPYVPRSYAYCSDTAPFAELSEWVNGVTLLYHEATFPVEMSEMAEKTCHSTTAQAAQCALDAGVGRLIVGHYSSRYPSVEFFLDELRSVFPETDLAHDGDVIELPLEKLR